MLLFSVVTVTVKVSPTATIVVDGIISIFTENVGFGVGVEEAVGIGVAVEGRIRLGDRVNAGEGVMMGSVIVKGGSEETVTVNCSGANIGDGINA